MRCDPDPESRIPWQSRQLHPDPAAITVHPRFRGDQPQPLRSPRVRPPQVGEERPLCAFYKLVCAELPHAGLMRYLEVYTSAVHSLKAVLTTHAVYVRPTESRPKQPFMQEKMPDIVRDKFEPGVIHSKTKFAKRAIARPSPHAVAAEDAARELPEDLTIAIDTVLRRGENIQRDRTQRLDALRTIAESLSDVRAALDACKSKEAVAISAPFNMAWTAAVIDAMIWPDIDIPV